MEQFQFNLDVNPDAREVQSLSNRIDTFNVEETRIYDFKELAAASSDRCGGSQRSTNAREELYRKASRPSRPA